MGDLGGFNLLAPLRNLTIRSCFPRDQPSTASCITFKVEGDSLRPPHFLQKRKHDSNQVSLGVFSGRRTPVPDQTPLKEWLSV